MYLSIYLLQILNDQPKVETITSYTYKPKFVDMAINPFPITDPTLPDPTQKKSRHIFVLTKITRKKSEQHNTAHVSKIKKL